MKEIETKELEARLKRAGQLLEISEKLAYQNDAIFDTTAAALTKAQDDFAAARARCEEDEAIKARTHAYQSEVYLELKARKQTEEQNNEHRRRIKRKILVNK